MADGDKSEDGGTRNTKCFICSCFVSTSGRGCVNIFETNFASVGGAITNRVCDSLSEILGIECRESSCRSTIICKKCYKLLYDINELESKVVYLKNEIYQKYQESLEKEKESDSNTIVVTVHPDQDLSNHEWIDAEEEKQTEPIKSEPVKTEPETPPKRRKTQVSVKLAQVEAVLEEAEEDFESIEFAAGDDKDSDYEPSEGGDDNDSDYVPSREDVQERVPVVTVKRGPKPKLKKKADAQQPAVKNEEKPPSKVKEEITAQNSVTKQGDTYVCVLCNIKNSEPKSITEHLKKYHSITLFICDVCDYKFTVRKKFKEHVDEHKLIEDTADENEEGEFQCEYCNRYFCNRRDFKVHKANHHVKYQCEKCGKFCNTKHLLDVHKRTHKEVLSFKCEQCNKEFTQKITYKVHMRIHKLESEHFTCEFCSKPFTSRARFMRHLDLHRGRKDFPCPMCEKVFTTKAGLKAHSVHHTGEIKSYICNICGKALTTRAGYVDHQRNHTGEKPFQCELCGMSYSRRSSLLLHKQSDAHSTARPFACHVCGKAYKKRDLLTFHIRSAHTGERSAKCSQCDATFVYPWHLKKHMRTHTGEKPYKCEICGKCFSTSDNRNSHRFTHSRRKPYECGVCGAGFMRKPQLFLHMESEGHNAAIIVNKKNVPPDEKDLKDVNVNGQPQQKKVMNKDVPPPPAFHERTPPPIPQEGQRHVYIQETNEHVIIPEMGTVEAIHVYGLEEDANVRNMDPNRGRVQHVIIEGPIHFQEYDGNAVPGGHQYL